MALLSFRPSCHHISLRYGTQSMMMLRWLHDRTSLYYIIHWPQSIYSINFFSLVNIFRWIKANKAKTKREQKKVYKRRGLSINKHSIKDYFYTFLLLQFPFNYTDSIRICYAIGLSAMENILTNMCIRNQSSSHRPDANRAHQQVGNATFRGVFNFLLSSALFPTENQLSISFLHSSVYPYQYQHPIH